MEYIILDLEWNGAYSKQHGRFINEIIEFGAVKLDEQLQEMDCFQIFVKSRLTKRLCERFKMLTNISNEEMASGVDFAEAVERYTRWAGPDALTLSWSDTDVRVLLDNVRSFLGMQTIPCIGKYADLQKYLQRRLGITGNQISLAAAAEHMQVDTAEFSAHRALDDSRLCAALLRREFDPALLAEYTRDTRRPDYYARLDFKPYFISDLTHPDIDKNELRFRCEVCGKFARRTTKWQFRSKAFRAAFRCRNCGAEFMGRVRFQKLYDGVRVKRWTAPLPEPAQEDGAQRQPEPAGAQNEA